MTRFAVANPRAWAAIVAKLESRSTSLEVRS